MCLTFWRSFLAEGQQSGEYRVVRSDGAVAEVEYRAVANILPGLHLSVLHDISGRKRLERELQQRVEQLAEADRLKGEALTTLAHELRGPLSPLLSAAQTIRLLAPADPNLQRASEVIARQVRHMTRLVDDLMDASRVMRRKARLRKEVLELDRVLEQAAEAVRRLVEARRQELTVSLPTESLRLEGDPTRLTQVLTNLLNNASKYSEEGGHIGLTAEREGGEVVLRVRDDGTGIAAEVLPRLFQMFVQSERAVGREQGGLGVGLALVKSLVELHGGSVTARSDGPGSGSEFVVRLPLLG